MKKRFSKKHTGTPAHLIGLKVAALFEAAKGLLVLVAGFGLLTYIHKDLHNAAEALVRHLHLNPASHYPLVFLDLAAKTGDSALRAMAAAAFIYAVIRIAESIGLWFDRRWAAWFGILTGSMYIPVEIFELTRTVTWPKVTVLTLNSAIVLYLLGHVITYRRR